ncbi:hypothetical protein B0T19DRAFT_205929 [Cercophora scortea]|uniref:Uncharacterized protein n=1 Tax=Cercophora scortea TaxID=314031 RepID=A0AAE0IE22_9PEZI|nr:hypothetical protein B0T19DRAFT_205929 [Cercophora scortea]
MIDNVEPFAFRPRPQGGKMAVSSPSPMISRSPPPNPVMDHAAPHNRSTDIPKPLQIVKRTEMYNGDNDRDSYGYSYRDHGRRCSTQSTASDESMESVPEPLGGDRPLALPKRRDNRNQNHNHNRGNGVQEASGGGVGSGLTKGADLFLGMREDRSATTSSFSTVPPSHSRPSSTTTSLRQLGTTTRGGRAGSPFTNKPSLLSSHAGRRNVDTYMERQPPPPPTAAEYLLSNSPSRRQRLQNGNSNSNGNSPWLRSSKSMLHLATTATGTATARSRDLDGGVYRDSPPPPPPPPQPPGPFILVPRIVVTPESKALEDGATTLWAAVQVSTQICRSDAPAPMVVDYAWAGAGGVGGGSQGGSSQFDVFQYGCLYDVSVEVLPTSSSVVIEVLDDGACANSTLYPGSRLLVVAHIRLLSAATATTATAAAASSPSPPARGGHARQSSDDLIEDLEYQLGSTATEYLQVRITYRHSAFPQRGDDGSLAADPRRPAIASSLTNRRRTNNNNTADDGVSSIQTVIVTTCRAAIKRHNALSPWSPRPAPQPNPLFEIIASHWGPDSASDVMHRILGSRSTPRKAANNLRPPAAAAAKSPPSAAARHTPARLIIPDPHLTTEVSEETLKPSPIPIPIPLSPTPAPTRAAPPIPKRQASLNGGQRRSSSFNRQQQQQQQQPHPLQHQETPPPLDHGGDAEQDSEDDDNDDGEDDPARRIWSEMRRASTGFRPSYLVSRVKRVPSGSVMPAPPGTPTRGPRESYAATARGRDGVAQQRQREREAGGLRERALRNMRSVGGAETLRGYGTAGAAAATVGGRFGGGGERGRGGMEGVRRSLDTDAHGRGQGGSLSDASLASGYHNRGGGGGEYRDREREQSVSANGGSGGKAKKEKEQSGRWGWSGWWP